MFENILNKILGPCLCLFWVMFEVVVRRTVH